MKRLLKWIGYGVAGLIAFLAVVAALGFAASEAMVRAPAEKLQVRALPGGDAGAAERGRAIAKLYGCFDCHGEKLEGRLFMDEMPLARAWGPNLSRLMVGQSDADLDRAIRQGVAADGRRLWIMPSSAFAHLTDQEMTDLLAHLRTYKPTGEMRPGLDLGPVGRIGVVARQLKSEPELLKANGAGLKLEDLGPQHAEGRDLARTCIECHGQTLKGVAVLKSPDLNMVASYEPEAFANLLHTGIAAGGRKVGLMSEISPVRFGALSSGQIEALRAYLKARAERQAVLGGMP